MSTEPTGKYSGMTLQDWIHSTANELDFDAVGFWQIVPVMRRGFGLSGSDLDRAVRDSLHALLARGALPVIGTVSDGNAHWIHTSRYGDEASDIADAVIAEWHSMGRDPDVGDIWFALPHLHGPDAPTDRSDGGGAL